MPRIGVGLGLGLSPLVAAAGGYDADAQAFFDRVTTAGGTLTTTEKNATNQLVLDMKSAGIWTSMKAVYPMVGASGNLLSYTNSWTNAIWQGSSITTGQTDPFGGTNAILCDVEKWQSFTYTTLTQYTISIYAKAGTTSTFTLGSDSPANYNCTFNLSTQTITNSTGYVGSMTNEGNGWYRCKITWTKDSGGALTQPFYDFKPSSGNMYFYGPQLEVGSIATAYMPVLGSKSAASAAACAQNLKSSSFTGTFSSGWTFASTGVKGNGTTNIFNTTLIPSTDLLQNDAHFSFYIRDNANAGKFQMGQYTPARVAIMGAKYNGTSAYIGINSSENLTASDTSNVKGFLTQSRIVSTESKYYKNNTLFDTNATTSTTPGTFSMYIGCINVNNTAFFPDTVEFAFASIGNGLSASNVSNFYTAVQAFQTTLSRQV